MAVVQHKSGHSVASANTVAVTMTSTTNKVIQVGTAAATASTHTVASVTDNIGNAYTARAGAAASANTNADRTEIWECLNASAGVTTITVTFSGTAGTYVKDAEAWEVSGFTNPVADGQGSSSDINLGSGSTWNGPTVTTTSTTGFLCAMTKVPAGSTITDNPNAGNEFSSGGDIASGTDSAGCSLVSVTAAGHTPAWTCGNSFISVCASVAAIKESAAASDTQEWRGSYPPQKRNTWPSVTY